MFNNVTGVFICFTTSSRTTSFLFAIPEGLGRGSVAPIQLRLDFHSPPLFNEELQIRELCTQKIITMCTS